MSDTPAAHVRITFRENGPAVVEGDFDLVDAGGNPLAHADRVVLCRCGHSATKPYCDGSHKRTGFTAPGVPPQRKPDRP